MSATYQSTRSIGNTTANALNGEILRLVGILLDHLFVIRIATTHLPDKVVHQLVRPALLPRHRIFHELHLEYALALLPLLYFGLVRVQRRELIKGLRTYLRDALLALALWIAVLVSSVLLVLGLRRSRPAPAGHADGLHDAWRCGAAGQHSAEDAGRADARADGGNARGRRGTP